MLYEKEVLFSSVDEISAKLIKFGKRIKSEIKIDVKDIHFEEVTENHVTSKVQYCTIVADIPEIEIVYPGYKVVGIVDYIKFKGSGKGMVSVFDENFSDFVNSFIDDKSFKCDHCNTIRRRNRAILVHNMNNDSMMVFGGNCLKYYLPVNANVDNLFYVYDKLDELDREIMSVAFSSINSKLFTKEEVIGIGLHFVEKQKGYISKSRAAEINNQRYEEARRINNITNLIEDEYVPYDMVYSTASLVREHIFEEKRNSRGQIIPKDDIDQKHFEEAKKLVSFITERMDEIYPSNLSFDMNMKTILNMDLVNYDTFPFLLSIIGAYNRIMAKMTKKEEELKNDTRINEYLGTIGEKISITDLKLISHGWTNGEFPAMRYSFEDKDGRTVTWFSSKDLNLENEKSYNVKGRVKNHTTFNGRLQTIITRCKIL